MKIAKATDQDFKVTREFLQACETIWDTRNGYGMYSEVDTWEQWDDDDPDKIEIMRLRKIYCREESKAPSEVDMRIILWEFLRLKYKAADAHWNRIVIAADTLIEHVCDPLADHLAFYPGYELFHVAPEQ